MDEETPMVVEAGEDMGRAAPSPTPKPKKASGGKRAKGGDLPMSSGGADSESTTEGSTQASKGKDAKRSKSPKPKPASKPKATQENDEMQTLAAPPVEGSSPDGDLPAVVAVMLGP